VVEDASIARQEAAFETQVSDAHPGSNELLVVYMSYFKWIKDTFPSSQERQLALLERATCELKENEDLKNDVRFVKMWIEYADMVRTPGEVFSFMQSNKIGERVALFWVAWAFVAEKAENFKLTDQIFQKGIRKNAEPKDLIAKRYKHFQRRMASTLQRMADAGADVAAAAAAATAQAEAAGEDRAPLARLSRARGTGSQRSGAALASSASGPLGGGQQASSFASSSARASGGASSSSSGSSTATTKKALGKGASSSAGNFQIFSDASAAPPPPPASSSSSSTGGGFQIFADPLPENDKWKHLASDADRRKENSLPASKWSQHGPLVAPRPHASSSSSSLSSPTRTAVSSTTTASIIPIFVDPEHADSINESSSKAPHEATASHRSVRRALDAPNTAGGTKQRGALMAKEAEKADPLARHKQPAPVATATAPVAVADSAPPPPPAFTKASDDAQQTFGTTRGRVEVMTNNTNKTSPFAKTGATSSTSAFQIFCDSPSLLQSKPPKGGTTSTNTVTSNFKLRVQEREEEEEEEGEKSPYFEPIRSSTTSNNMSVPVPPQPSFTSAPPPASSSSSSYSKRASAVACEEEDPELESIMNEMGLLDSEDATINTRLARQHIDSMFCSPVCSPEQHVRNHNYRGASSSSSASQRSGGSDRGSATKRSSGIRQTTSPPKYLATSSNPHCSAPRPFQPSAFHAHDLSAIQENSREVSVVGTLYTPAASSSVRQRGLGGGKRSSSFGIAGGNFIDISTRRESDNSMYLSSTSSSSKNSSQNSS